LIRRSAGLWRPGKSLLQFTGYFALIAVNVKTARSYTQTTRAEATKATRERILEALVALTLEAAPDTSLAAVAVRAEVSVQTVLRHFGTRERLFDEALAHGTAKIAAERTAPIGNPPEDLRILVNHYELRGDGVIALLAQESHDERIATIVRVGRTTHRQWVTTVFAPWLATLSEDATEERTRLLIVATDVYSWKLLRRDMRLSRRATERHLLQLVTAVLTGDPALPSPTAAVPPQ
jgi:AcrR family transcriptional regulator